MINFNWRKWILREDDAPVIVWTVAFAALVTLIAVSLTGSAIRWTLMDVCVVNGYHGQGVEDGEWYCWSEEWVDGEIQRVVYPLDDIVIHHSDVGRRGNDR